MRYLKDTGFIIKKTNLFDTDKYITVFTKNHGKVEILAKGVRRINSRRSPHLELINLVKFQTVKTKVNYILTDIEVINTFSGLRDDYSKIGVIFLICELVDKLCPEYVRHADIFELIEKSVNGVYNNKLPQIVFDFQVQLLSILGFWNPEKEFKNHWEIDRFIEDVIEKKIKSKLILKL